MKTNRTNRRAEPLGISRTEKTLLGLFLPLIFFVGGCATKPVSQAAPNPDTERRAVAAGAKKILIFFDGTANEWDTRTNVRRLFELISAREDPKRLSLYVDGVGSSSFPLTGRALGYGLKPRILEGYKFLARYYNSGDQIYIFGFSRGAHQARALAGLLAHSGLPKAKYGEQALEGVVERIWDASKDQDDASADTWRTWNSSKPPLFADDLKDRFGIETVASEVAFLGVWDTVPGSQFKEYSECSELPDGKEGIRYKLRSYPPIREIAHAVSIDEKRSEFRAVLVCQAMDPARTVVHQQWFPGAHADVGGGYEDSNDLAGISLNWMLGLLEKHDLFAGPQPRVYSDPAGLAHASICDFPGNVGSEYKDRDMQERPALHASVQERIRSGPVPLRKRGKIVYEPYTGSAKTTAESKREYCRKI